MLGNPEVIANHSSGLPVLLDILDKLIKLAAVVMGGLWTYWNYRKSRTYAQKLELQLAGNLFLRDDLYLDVTAGLKNLGASRHVVQQAGTYCDVIVILRDLSEESLRIFPVFTRNDSIEPGESIMDSLYWRIPRSAGDIIWVKLQLRVVSGSVEWNASYLMRVEAPVSSVDASNP